MPVFHTKTIEGILDPVSHHVSELIIFHEEWSTGTKMLELRSPIQTVSAAVANLLDVSRSTLVSSTDTILQQDLPVALDKVVKANQLLIDSVSVSIEDPYSTVPKEQLIDGARGLLSGTSSLILTVDESEVRKILKQCRAILEYFLVGEVVESFEDLSYYTQSLRSGMASTIHAISNRANELTFVVHAQGLRFGVEKVKNLTTSILSAIKLYVTAVENKSSDLQFFIDRKNFLTNSLYDEIVEIMRILQLTTCEESESKFENFDDLKRLQFSINGYIDLASEWNRDFTLGTNCVEYKAFDHLLNLCTKSSLILDKNYLETIAKASDDLSDLSNDLVLYRVNGNAKSIDALSASAKLDQTLGVLKNVMKEAVYHKSCTSPTKPAPLLSAALEQTMEWLRDPLSERSGIGKQAIDSVIKSARNLAKICLPNVAADIMSICDEIQKLASLYEHMNDPDLSNTVEARTLADSLRNELSLLTQLIMSEDVLMREVVGAFMDIIGPANRLKKAAFAPLSEKNRVDDFNIAVEMFKLHTEKMVETAKKVVKYSDSLNHSTISAIQKYAEEVDKLSPQLSGVAFISFTHPDIEECENHFKIVHDSYKTAAEMLVQEINDSVDIGTFIKASVLAIATDADAMRVCVEDNQTREIANFVSLIARRAKRVVDFSNKNADNCEDDSYRHSIKQASMDVDFFISPLIAAAKQFLINTTDPISKSRLLKLSRDLVSTIDELGDRVTRSSAKCPASTTVYEEPSNINVDQTSSEPGIVRSSRPRAPVLPESHQGLLPDAYIDDDTQMVEFPLPSDEQPILKAARSLHLEAQKWQSSGNQIIPAAKFMAILMAELSRLVRGEGKRGTKKQLILCARKISCVAQEVVKGGKLLSDQCIDRRMKKVLLESIDKIPTISNQLKILSTVKAAMMGDLSKSLDCEIPESASKEDIEATEMLVGNAKNLMAAVKDAVLAAEAASIKIRTDSGYTISWIRKSEH